MRLPTNTCRQQKVEDARELHERLYLAWLEGRKVFFAVGPEQDTIRTMMRAESNAHQFWRRRGWVCRCQASPTKDGFWLWVQPRREMQAEKAAYAPLRKRIA